MWFFTALFGGLILLSVESRRRMIAIMLIGCICGSRGCATTGRGVPRLGGRADLLSMSTRSCPKSMLN
jgi:hypothetical protein